MHIHTSDIMSEIDLYCACKNGEKDKVVRLLSKGVSAEAFYDEDGWSALHWASDQGHLAVVQVLIEAGVHVDVRSTKGDTPLHWACYKGHVDVARCLLEAGALLNARNKWNDTPLHNAARRGHLPVMVLLIVEYEGLELLQTRGWDNETPVQKAQLYWHTDVVDYIKQIEQRHNKHTTNPGNDTGFLENVTTFLRHGSFRKVQSKTSATEGQFDTKFGEYNLNFSKPLGKGTFGVVYQARHVKGGPVVALKRIIWSVDLRDLPIDPRQELISYKMVPDHENVLKLLDHDISLDRQLVLVTEFCNGGDLVNFFTETCPALHLRCDLMEQASLGILHLHSQRPPVVHRDIKPQNMLLHYSGQKLLLKIADFGFARPVEASRLGTFCGTLTYIAPDILPDGQTEIVSYTRDCDIFSLGLVFQAMLLYQRGDSGLNPKIVPETDPDKGVAQQMRLAEKLGQPIPLLAQVEVENRYLGDKINTIIQKMTQYNAKDRISFKDVNAQIRALNGFQQNCLP